jgi:hypothetical protein
MSLDIIHLRATPAAIAGVLELLSDCPQEDPNLEIYIYRREGLPGDISVHVVGPETDGRSKHAERIANELRSFGLVQLTRWVAVPRLNPRKE